MEYLLAQGTTEYTDWTIQKMRYFLIDFDPLNQEIPNH